MAPPSDVAKKLSTLRDLLERLPAKPSPSGFAYPFETFTVDKEWLEITESIQGSINHSLEVAFGSRVSGNPIELRSHGPDLVAVVDVLSNGITGSDGENIILLKWVADLQTAARHALAPVLILDDDEASTEPSNNVKRIRKSTSKRAMNDEEAQAKEDAKKQKLEEKERAEKMKSRTKGNFIFDPQELQDRVIVRSNKGPKPDPLLELLVIPCVVISDPSQERWRCSAPGCQYNAAEPRSNERVLPHSMDCKFLSEELRERAAAAASSRSLGARIEAMNLNKPSSRPTQKLSQPSVHASVQAEGRDKRNTKHNYNVLRLVCGMSLPPTLIDSEYWKATIGYLDPNMRNISGSQLAHSLIPSEAAHVRKKSVEELRTHTHLTISFDGATTRANQSVYTVHVTTPDKREAHLLLGDEATGESHTGEHLKELLLRVVNEVGAKHFSAVTSDSTGNTRLARELLAKEFPHIIVLPDPCHHMNNTAKDIGDLAIFSDANAKLRVVVRYFRKSAFAAHHLKAWRIIMGIALSLVSTNKTRFLMLFYAIEAFLPQIQIITDLVCSGVIKTNSRHPLAWMLDYPTVRDFTDHLEQEKALLEPFARATKCLESSQSTPADVLLYWLACQATLCDIFTDTQKRRRLLLTDETISEVHGIVNARYAEMLEGPHRRVYVTTLFLDPHYLCTTLFSRRSLNPLNTSITLPPRSTTSSHPEPDADLRASIPTYQIAGSYLGELLVNEINTGRLPCEITRSYPTAHLILEEFRTEFTSYVRQRSPFDRYSDSKTPLLYWERLSRHFDSVVLSYLAIKLYSVVPNSMAEERTVSNFTKLNSPDRGRQKTSTLVYMTQIKQHEQRLKNDKATRCPAPTVRFRDLSDLAAPTPKKTDKPIDKEATQGAAVARKPDTVGEGQPTVHDSWENDAGFDEEIEVPPRGPRDGFPMAEGDGVNLNEPCLRDLLSDDPIPGVIERGQMRTVSSATGTTSGNSKPAGPLRAELFKF